MISYFIILTITILILFVMMFITTNHLNSRLIRNEEYLKTISEENKQLKLLLKREVAMANNEAYPFIQSHINYVPWDES